MLSKVIVLHNYYCLFLFLSLKVTVCAKDLFLLKTSDTASLPSYVGSKSLNGFHKENSYTLLLTSEDVREKVLGWKD